MPSNERINKAFLLENRDKFKAMARTFTWNAQRHQKLKDALTDQISDDTPVACIWEDARIGSYADPSLKSFSIDNNEAIQAFTNCLKNRDTSIYKLPNEVTRDAISIEEGKSSLGL